MGSKYSPHEECFLRESSKSGWTQMWMDSPVYAVLHLYDLFCYWRVFPPPHSFQTLKFSRKGSFGDQAHLGTPIAHFLSNHKFMKPGCTDDRGEHSPGSIHHMTSLFKELWIGETGGEELLHRKVSHCCCTYAALNYTVQPSQKVLLHGAPQPLQILPEL